MSGGGRGKGKWPVRPRALLATSPPPTHPPPDETCSRKGAPGTRCRLVLLRSKEKGDDTKRQDVSSASSISPPARQRWKTDSHSQGERSRRARGGHSSSVSCLPDGEPLRTQVILYSPLFAEANTGPSTQTVSPYVCGMDGGMNGTMGETKN